MFVCFRFQELMSTMKPLLLCRIDDACYERLLRVLEVEFMLDRVRDNIRCSISNKINVDVRSDRTLRGALSAVDGGSTSQKAIFYISGPGANR